MKLFGIVVIIILMLAGVMYFYPRMIGDGAVAPSTQDARGTKSYSNAEYGISFTYPDSYTLLETNASADGQDVYQILLADRVALENAPQNGEGPTAITIHIFANHGATSTEGWIRTAPQSNFALSPNSALTSVQVGDVDGYTYVWDGLYRGASVVFEHRERIFMASATMFEPTDAIVGDFARLLDTLKLQ